MVDDTHNVLGICTENEEGETSRRRDSICNPRETSLSEVGNASPAELVGGIISGGNESTSMKALFSNRVDENFHLLFSTRSLLSLDGYNATLWKKVTH